MFSATDSRSTSSASSIRSVQTSTGPSIQPSSSKFPYQLLLSPQFLICAGAILFRGIPPLSSSNESGNDDETSCSPLSRGRKHASTITNGRGPLVLVPEHEPELQDPSSTNHLPRNRSSAPSLSLTNTNTNGYEHHTNAITNENHDEPPSSSSPLEVCIIYHQRKNEYILAKGRKDQFEIGLLDAALRETHEETGYPCRVFPVGMNTRAPLPGADIKDQKLGLPVLNCTEPFALTIRSIAPDNVKLIHWFIAETTSTNARFEEGTRMPSEYSFESLWFEPEEAVERLTYEHDKDVVRRAVELVREEVGRRRRLAKGMTS